MRRIRSHIFILLLVMAPPLYADVHDPLDPFDRGQSDNGEDQDKDKTAEQLVEEGDALLQDERPLDARTKLLKALQKDPKEFRAHLLLSGYYMVHVGHFRLAFKYVKQAQQLFDQKFGPPPYSNLLSQRQHAHILYLLSQARLNLDDYQGALDELDRFTSFGYYADWYPGTRAWILMKLNRIDEAIRIAKLGILAGAETGRTSNMLGILLSMKGERSQSLEVFKSAYAYELSLGTELGAPATPLNNAGEVYKEIFNEDEAQAHFLKATSLPDGCEHVLPSLNLALLYIEELNFSGAKRAMDSFESCVAQYPLRNGEEHQALVNLARGNIDLHIGLAESAIKRLDSALQARQWFGKIGTSSEDLEAAALISLARALYYRNNQLQFIRPQGFSDWFDLVQEKAKNTVQIWWLKRRARQLLTETLSNLEDLFVRNTDSLIEYHSFGEILADLPAGAFERRLTRELSSDNRDKAKTYYRAYQAENLLAHGSVKEAAGLIDQALSGIRPRYDDALKLHLMVLKLKTLSADSPSWNQQAIAIFSLNRATLRNYGEKLPVTFSIEDNHIAQELKKSAFRQNPDQDSPFSLSATKLNGEYVIDFKSTLGQIGDVRATGKDLSEAVNKLNDQVFVLNLS